MTPKIFIWGKRQTYGNYAAAVAAAGGNCRFSADWTDAAVCDGLLLPGGGDLAPWRYGQENTASRGLDLERDAAEFALLARFTDARKPVLGVCRGLQTINVFFGGTLLQDLPGHSAVDGIDRLHHVRTAPSPLSSLYGDNALVNSAHHQAADRMGTGLQAVQWADDGTVEALYHETLPVWAVQWHPERLRGSGTADGALLFRAFLSLCRKE